MRYPMGEKAMSAATISRDLILGEVGERLGVATWKVQRVYTRGLLPPARRIGRFRVVSEDELPALEAALRQAGYLPRETTSAAPEETHT